jgi:prevent-host-death family protein
MKSATELMTISQFKATCLAVLERVRRTGQPVLVTRRGELVAEIVPPPPTPPNGSWIGSLRGAVRIKGDIIAPTSEPADWDALR